MVYGQSSFLNNDEYKKELWKTIKPTTSSPLQSSPKIEMLLKENSNEGIIDNKYLRSYYKYKSGDLLDKFKDKYQINPSVLIYKGDIPLNMLPAGSTAIVFMGGHFHFIPTGGTMITPSGINLSGWSKKTLSPKSRAIIEQVFGMEVE
ncbi:hypothetical protein D0T53_08225 [Dysgonomonas sp. 216]|nr:hypothetical protein [Dysgonomonas sp. 216]